MIFKGAGVQFEGDLGKIIAIVAEISSYIGLREEKYLVSLKKIIFRFYIWSAHRRQALMTVESHYILRYFSFDLMLIHECSTVKWNILASPNLRDLPKKT